MKPLLSIKELAEITGEKYSVIYNLVTRHRIASARRLGGTNGPWRVSSDAAIALFPEAFARALHPAPPEETEKTMNLQSMVGAGASA